MHVFFTGGSGVVGRPVVAALSQAGHEVTVVTRRPAAQAAMGAISRVRLVEGDITRSGAWQRDIDGVDVVVHFGGASLVGKALTPQRLTELITDRRTSTHELARGLAEARRRPRAVLLGSGVGYYGDDGGRVDENSPRGEGLTAELFGVSETLAAHLPADISATRLRFGQVLSRKSPLLKASAAQLPSPSTDPLSWVHIFDAVTMVKRLVEQPFPGAINVCSPVSTDVAQLHMALGFQAVKRGALSRLLGRGAPIDDAPKVALLTGQRASPSNAEAIGFSFRFDKIDAAVADVRRQQK